jgi:hypothetical protein
MTVSALALTTSRVAGSSFLSMAVTSEPYLSPLVTNLECAA